MKIPGKGEGLGFLICKSPPPGQLRGIVLMGATLVFWAGETEPSESPQFTNYVNHGCLIWGLQMY